MKSLSGLILTGGLLITSVFAAANSSEEVKINEVIASYEQALNDSNTRKIISLYSDSPTFMPQHAPAQTGRLAVGNAYEQVFNSIDLEVDFTIHEIEVLGDTAWARTSSSGETTILANAAVIREGNNELFVFKKVDGDWKIHQYLFATSLPRK